MSLLTDLAVDLISIEYKIKPIESRKFYRSTIGIPFRNQLEVLFPHHESNSRVAEQYENNHRAMAPTFALAINIELLFKELNDRGYMKALVTSTDWVILRDCLPQVRSLGFDFLSGYGTGNDKLVQIDKSIRVLEADLSKTLYVGDSPFDKECAILSGIPFVQVETHSVYDEVMFAIQRMEFA